MQRRHFLQKTSLAVVAAAGLPLAINRYNQSTPSNYKTDLIAGKANQVSYAITLYHDMFLKFAEAKPEDRQVSLIINAFDSSNTTTASRTASGKYPIGEAELIDKVNNIWKLTALAPEPFTGDEKLVAGLPKGVRLLVKPYSYADIIGKKDKTFAHMIYNQSYSPSSDADCFLTTACVHQQNLADDCMELRTLRALRDEYMLLSAEGRALVDQYQLIGPALVNKIGQYANSEEIYQYMYEKMILPAVGLVQNKRPEEAVEYYSVFVKALTEKYC